MRQAAGRARQSRFAILLGLIVVLGLAAAPAQAQTDTLPRVTLTSIDTANFPDISATVAVSGPNGLRVPGLTRGAFTLLENSSPVAIGQIAEEEIGLQIAFVVESSDIFLRRDINTLTRLDYVKTAIINFAVGEGAGGNPYMKDVVDNVTILAPEGAIVQSSVVGGEIRNALVTYESEFRFETGLLNLITQAMDVVTTDAPRAGMKREMVIFTSGIDASADAEVSALAARANTEAVTIHTVLVGSTTAPGLPMAENVQALAELTGGSYRYFAEPAATNSLWDTLVSQRAQYRLNYRSGLNQSGQHTLQALANLSGASVLSPGEVFSLTVQPPLITFASIPAEIVRTTAERGADTTTIDPREQQLAVKIEFPDGHPRRIIKLQLIVDNAIAAETTNGPFDSATWDLTGYSETGTHGLQLYTIDELGLEGRSNITNVTVRLEVPPPLVDLAAPFAAGALGIGVTAIAMAALVIAVIVLLRRPTVITSVVRERRTQSSKEPTEPFIPTPHRGAAINKPGKAFLQRVDKSEPGPHPTIEVIGDNLRLGRDETLAQIAIDDRSVSRLHARITEEADRVFFIHDEGSTSGTWVNYHQVSMSGQQLRHGDLINLGRVQLRFNVRHIAAAAPDDSKAAPPTEQEPEHSTEPFEAAVSPIKQTNESTDQGLKPSSKQPTQPVQDEYHTEAFAPPLREEEQANGKQ